VVVPLNAKFFTLFVDTVKKKNVQKPQMLWLVGIQSM
jgi:hypothetical protein